MTVFDTVLGTCTRKLHVYLTWETSVHVLSSSRVFGRENRTWQTKFRYGLFHKIRIWLHHFRQQADPEEIRYSVTRWLIGRNCYLKWIPGFRLHLVLAIRQELSSGTRTCEIRTSVWGYEKNHGDCSTRYLVLIAWICWQAYISEQVGDIVLTNLMWSIGAYFWKYFCIGCNNLCVSLQS